jgi:YgiT-type zinc finger domain-containing protein
MKCCICKTGDTQPAPTTVVLQREGTVVVVKSVPADVCVNCGEYYLDEPVTQRVLAIAQEAVDKGTEVEILRYAA